VPDSQNITTPSVTESNNSRVLGSTTINTLLAIPSVASQVNPALINSGALPNVNINDYNSATPSQKSAYDAQLATSIASGNQKLTQVASNALTDLGY
jgi:hypothetical protein